MKKALITGITGQDGSYLAELLLSKGYEVHGLIRRNSTFEVPPNIAHIKNNLILHYGDVSDSANLRGIVTAIKPDEVYNLAAQSHVQISFEIPEFTSEVDGFGVLKVLEAVRLLSKEKPVKFYQASSSELFGKVLEIPQTENTPFYPRSPYGVSKLYGHWITINYRESYDLFACTGILFNHESPRRGENFVTRKITKGFARIFHTGDKSPIQLGNLNALRDWGHAKDFVEGMWLILQQEKPDDYVLATGKQYSVRDFCNKTASWFNTAIEWTGSGDTEKGYDKNTGNLIIAVNPEYYRPADVNTLLGDSTKARTILGWSPKHNLDDLINDMCEHDTRSYL